VLTNFFAKPFNLFAYILCHNGLIYTLFQHILQVL